MRFLFRLRISRNRILAWWWIFLSGLKRALHYPLNICLHIIQLSSYTRTVFVEIVFCKKIDGIYLHSETDLHL